ncbi:cytochrome P450 [Artomyces pyxidatus]|uniref:Cytochrome P450 n=1 Tax=Artomyces pyxidatus TaxID=48021 RepID=A0ACB8SML0_9AGAM|nr:cytochrome P450 [Artomyces pyxidatus]
MPLDSRNYSLPASFWLVALAAASFGIGLALFSLARLRIRQIVLWPVPSPQCASLFTGNLLQMFHPVSGFDFREHVRKTYGPVSRFHGLLGDQVLLISDPKALTSMLGKNQDAFEETEWFIECFRHVIGPGLFSSTGALHRKQRKLLNPIFSTHRMRSMVPLIHKITVQLLDILQEKVADGVQEIEMSDWFGRLALEMIAQGGLGHTFESFRTGAENDDFRTAIKEFSPAVARLQVFLSVFPLVSKWPSKLLRFGAACLPWPDLHYIIKLADTMGRSAKRLFETKRELLANEDAGLKSRVDEGKDIISVLMRENADVVDDSRMQDDEIMAQMITMLVAATDTTSLALSRIAYLLSQHQDAQDRLREEVNNAVASGGTELGYDTLVGLPHLDAIYRESLRLHPPASFVAHVCNADTTIALSRPIPGALTQQSSLFVPRGTIIIVDILGVNRDQSIWGGDADSWKPERWLAPLPDSVADAHIPGVYGNMMTFLGGSRSCIGFKLSELEIKVALSQLVRSFRFLPSKEEVVWRLGPVTTPSVKGSTTLTPKLPMLLKRA